MARNAAVKASASNHFCTSTYANGKQSAITQWMEKAEMKGPTSDCVSIAHILNKTTHRNGAIYKRHSGFLGLWPLTRRGESKSFLMPLPYLSCSYLSLGFLPCRD